MACRRVTDSRIANIFEDRLADVWVCQMEKYREYDRFIKCSKCELKAWCRGCPAVANGTNGDFYGADPVKSRLLCKMLYNVFTISTYQN